MKDQVKRGNEGKFQTGYKGMSQVIIGEGLCISNENVEKGYSTGRKL